MKTVYFGFGQQFDKGCDTDVAMNAQGVVVEVHKSDTENTLWCHVGQRNKATVDWGGSVHYADGVLPACAINNKNNVVAVHRSATSTGMVCLVGSVSEGKLQWHGSQQYDTGLGPRVAMNDAGVIVEVHRSSSESKLWYHVGQLDGTRVIWSPSRQYDTGDYPHVAINNEGVVVEVHCSSKHNDLWYHVGHIKGDWIEWGDSIKYDTGANPSVALTEDGFVIEVHESEHEVSNNLNLWRRVGLINGLTIDWIGSGDYDNGERPAVACAGKVAIQTHQSSDETSLWFSTSLIAERRSWMQDNLEALQAKTLKDVTLPASHDSGMYVSVLGQTQNKDIYDQLCYGIRYFDLRPGWAGIGFYIYHGEVLGPPLSDVLADIQRFMEEGHRELIILKFSHFKDIDDDLYPEMVSMIRSALHRWLLPSLPADQRLADIPLGELIAQSGVILPVCSGDLPVNHAAEGIWVYRDWDSKDPEAGDLCVYDRYSDTTSYSEMKEKQIERYQTFKGTCESNPSVPCDLFLLSWTLTPITHVWTTCKEANLNLGAEMAKLEVPNSRGLIPNIFYVDYVETARVTDVAILQNDLG